MSEYIITIEDWFFKNVHERYTHFFGCPIEEIVRCRDCREYNTELYRHISCELLGRYVEPDGFCACGEREDGDAR